MNTTQKIGSKLKIIRELNNYTQEYVANMLDISSSTYALMEKGQTPVTIQRMEKLGELYNMSINDLLQLSEQTIIHHIEHSASIGNENVINNMGLSDDERNLYKQVIARLEQQNEKLHAQIEQQNLKLITLFDKLADKI